MAMPIAIWSGRLIKVGAGVLLLLMLRIIGTGDE
jgi:hypothetical protein